MKTWFVIVSVVLSLAGAAVAGVCKGETPCKACKDCSQCAYCRPGGKGSCNVKREQADREYAARQRAREALKR